MKRTIKKETYRKPPEPTKKLSNILCFDSVLLYWNHPSPTSCCYIPGSTVFGITLLILLALPTFFLDFNAIFSAEGSIIDGKGFLGIAPEAL